MRVVIYAAFCYDIGHRSNAFNKPRCGVIESAPPNDGFTAAVESRAAGVSTGSSIHDLYTEWFADL